VSRNAAMELALQAVPVCRLFRRLGFDRNLLSNTFVYMYRTATLTDTFWESCQGVAKLVWKGRKAIKDKRLWILLAGIALISAAFLPLNFRVAVSNTQAIQRIITTELEGHYPDRLQRTDKISLVLVGEGSLVHSLQKALTEQMDKAGIGQIELEQELKSKYPNPVLVIKVDRPSLFWTPFFAISQFSVQVGYATNGDTTFLDVLDKTKPYIRNPNPAVVNLYTESEGNDRSLGLISRLGYHQYLADYLAEQIVQALKNLYNIQDPTGGTAARWDGVLSSGQQF
jgi:hypothetical protein